MNAVCPARQRNISSVVDDDTYASAPRPVDDAPDQPAQDAGLEVPLAHLDEINARLNGLIEKALQYENRRFGVRVGRQAVPVRDETEDWT